MKEKLSEMKKGRKIGGKKPQNSALVVVSIQIIRSRKESNNSGESSAFILQVHTIALVLCFMSSNDGKEPVSIEELANSSAHKTKEKERKKKRSVSGEEWI
jgi:hypothetical protein